MSFPRYPKYKDSGVEWLGEVPEHWKLSKIKHIASITGGGTPNREIMAYWNGSIPWVSPKDMKAESIVGAEESITELGLQNSSSTLQSAGRMLMVIRSGILQHTIPVAINTVPVALNQDMKSFCFHEGKCLSRFFLRWVQGLNDILLLEWANQGATVESVNQTLLQNTVIPIPDTPEQRLITAFLDRETAKIDELVAEQRRLIELLKEKRQAVISHAVTKGLNPNVPMKPSGIEWLGDVPEHWQIGRLSHLVNTRKGVAFKADDFTDEGTNVVKASDIKELSIRTPSTFLPTERVKEHPRAVLEANELVLSTVGSSPDVRNSVVGQLGRVPVELAGSLLNQNTVVFKPDETNLMNDFLYCLIQTIGYRDHLDLHAHGTANQASLNVSDMLQFQIPLPPRWEQVAIAEYVDRSVLLMANLSSDAQRGIELLQERRTALISATVTGKIDVRSFGPQIPEFA